MDRHIRLLVADDHEVVRVGLRTLLGEFPDLEVIAEAADAKECLALAESLQPDIILMDIRLPGMNGIEACRSIKKTMPNVAVIMLTSYDSQDYVQEAVQAGASGYILKQIGNEGLVRMIHAVMGGNAAFDHTTLNNVVRNLKKTSAQEELWTSLTHVEKRVLKLVSLGKPNREIATELNLSEKTVRNYMTVIMEKLQLNNRTEAAAFYLSLKIED